MRFLCRTKAFYRWMLCLFLIMGCGVAGAADLDLNQAYGKLREKLLGRYQPTIEKLAQSEKAYEDRMDQAFTADTEFGRDALPDHYAPWWTPKVEDPVTQSSDVAREDVETLFVRALKHSSQIKVFSDLPLIRETTIQEAEGPYDFRVFAEGKYGDISEPVGDDLRTGGPPRFEQDSRSIAAGLKKRFLPGTEVELSQELEGIDNNSIFFNPHDQALATTRLIVKQPLLRGGGITYNRSVIDLAKMDHSISEDELRRQVESHLLEIARAYWGLYLERAVLVQKKKLAQETHKLYRKMKQRVGVDVPASLLARAKSQVVARQLDAVEAEFAMKNASDRIRALVNDPGLIASGGLEIITRQVPQHRLESLDLGAALHTALENRPEVEQALKQIKSAAIRLQRSKNELWPDLNLFFETYVMGLEGDFQYDRSYHRQFDEGRPSYNVGLRFEYPLGNNAAEARERRKRIEVRQLLNQLDTTVQNVFLEVQVSFREVIKNYKEMVRRYQVMDSNQEEIKALLARVDYLLSENEAYGDVLYRLMDALDRLNDAEAKFAQSELTYNLSLYNINRSMGTLIAVNDIRITRTEQKHLPLIVLEKK